VSSVPSVVRTAFDLQPVTCNQQLYSPITVFLTLLQFVKALSQNHDAHFLIAKS